MQGHSHGHGGECQSSHSSHRSRQHIPWMRYSVQYGFIILWNVVFWFLFQFSTLSATIISFVIFNAIGAYILGYVISNIATVEPRAFWMGYIALAVTVFYVA